MSGQGGIVQKYGGTSVGTVPRIQAIARRIREQVRAGDPRIAVVVSAMSGETNRLVDLIRQANPRARGAHYDIAVAAGEQVSVGLMAAALEAEGLGADPFLGHQLGIRTDSHHSRARILRIETTGIHRCWENRRIPVIAGFQGVSADNAITTLGRGGSDTSAVALAVALKADLCEINTDVDGVYTADPRIVPEARPIEVLDFETALELASLGSKVLHIRCVELAAKYRMPLVVRRTSDDENGRRTRIMHISQDEVLEAPVVNGVTMDRNVARVTVEGLREDLPVLSDLFRQVADQGINVDIIIHDRDPDASLSVGFTVSNNDLDATLEAVEQLKERPGYEKIRVKEETGLAKISAVGLGMRSHFGVAERVFRVLAEEDIPVLMISTSEIKISCVVPESLGEKATQALHRHFFSAS